MAPTPELPKVHPLMAALEQSREPTVMLRGFLGTSEPSVIRLYQSLDTSTYVEFPAEKAVYLEAMGTGDAGEVRAFVPTSVEVLEVTRRRVRLADLGSVQAREPPRFPPLQPKPTFWTCAAGCEGVFASEATQILVAEVQALQAPPAQQAVLLAQIEQRKHEAKRALLACLESCTSRYPVPAFIAVPDDSPTGFHVERFSLGLYHQILVAKYLEKSA